MGRSKRTGIKDTSVLESVVPAVEKTAETVSELAGRAAVAAREAQRVATPVLRSAAQGSAETLSHAAEKAAEVLADAAERLAQDGSDGVTKTAQAAIKRAPHRWQRRLRRMAVAGGVVGTAYVVVTKTAVKSKLSELIFGPPLDEEEPEPITLPVTDQAAPGAQAAPSEPQSASPTSESDAPSTSE
jgi:negative regulator of sigma E activity